MGKNWSSFGSPREVLLAVVGGVLFGVVVITGVLMFNDMRQENRMQPYVPKTTDEQSIQAGRAAVKRAEQQREDDERLAQQAGNDITTLGQESADDAKRAAQAEQEADRPEILGDTVEERAKPRWIRIRPGTKVEMLAQRVQAKLTARPALVEWLRPGVHPAEFGQLEVLAKDFTGKPMTTVLFTVPGNPTTKFVKEEMAAQGLRPANAAELMAYVIKMTGRDKKIRINAIGGDPFVIEGENSSYYTYAIWQSDPLFYEQKGDPKTWRPTWAFSLYYADPPSGWNRPRGQNGAEDQEPTDYFLAVKIDR